ncbi:hypothetical protein DR66_4273 [Delftia acidovorans]|uniref:hypothetical protein n=1 Tax=Delftia acidovorans TaxID=80866 RepID=UPI000501F22B|nr:hypothetical protein [Delftia acidovorans]KFJ12951.1 hypothetical protein DR66_4273 [Delftia acidovorans]QQB47843.1 hypothetical protein I6H54_15665 [Delftia acidovorans]
MKERPILFSASMVRALLAGTKTQTRRICKPAMAHNLSHVVEVPDPQERGQVYNGTTFGDEEGAIQFTSPYGGMRDRLWVRETFYAWGRWETRFSARKARDEWHFVDMTLECGKAYQYAGDRPQPLAGKRDGGTLPKWFKRPAIHMPRAASRISLEITGVRVERLQDISEADADAEGCERLETERYERDWKLCPKCGGTRLHNALGGNGGVILDVDCWECDTYAKRYRHLWTAINGPDSWVQNPWVWVVEFKRVQQASSGRPSQLEDAPCSA